MCRTSCHGQERSGSAKNGVLTLADFFLVLGIHTPFVIEIDAITHKQTTQHSGCNANGLPANLHGLQRRVENSCDLCEVKDGG